MRPRTAFAAAVFAFVWAICGSAAGARVTIWSPGAWSWFGDPRAVHVGGRSGDTFAEWIDWSGRVTIGAYDPSLGLLGEYVVAQIFHDDHSDPSILVEPDQRLTVFWSGHNGAQMDYRTTVRAGDISAWTAVRHVEQGIPGPNGFT
jgi:hypothetical protein